MTLQVSCLVTYNDCFNYSNLSSFLASPDYTLPASFFVTFDTNSMSGDTLCVTIGLAPDTLKEGDESFTVSISDSGDAGTQTPTSATVTIEDDDGKFRIYSNFHSVTA